MQTLYLITGPAGVGKSTISNLIANKLEKSCLIEGDDIYGIVKNGYVPAWKDGNHLDLFWKNCIALIKNCLDKGFDVVFNYIIPSKTLEFLKENFKDFKIKFVVLMCNKEILIERDKKRLPENQMGERCLILLNKFLAIDDFKKYFFDTSSVSLVECADYILNNPKFYV